MSMADNLIISTFPKTQSLKDNTKICLVLLHGWGLNSAVWQPFINDLPESFFRNLYYHRY